MTKNNHKMDRWIMEQTYQESLAVRKNGIIGLSYSQSTYQAHVRLTFKENEDK